MLAASWNSQRPRNLRDHCDFQLAPFLAAQTGLFLAAINRESFRPRQIEARRFLRSHWPERRIDAACRGSEFTAEAAEQDESSAHWRVRHFSAHYMVLNDGCPHR